VADPFGDDAMRCGELSPFGGAGGGDTEADLGRLLHGIAKARKRALDPRQEADFLNVARVGSRRSLPRQHSGRSDLRRPWNWPSASNASVAAISPATVASHVYIAATALTFRRRELRSTAPRPNTPISISAQVEGSGTAPTLNVEPLL
jgi:hypothetical protein